MIRFLGFYKRRPDLTNEQFRHHWMNIHGPLVASTPGGDKYLKKYIQHHLTPDPLSQSDLLYDGFSEGWFESLEARDAFIKLPFVQKEVVEDEAKFIDLSASRWMVLDDHVLQIDLAEWPHPLKRPAK
jgi:uncharacterized protein (TIGR02118 family)